MWKRKEDEYTPRPTAIPPTSPDITIKEHTPMQSAPVRNPEPAHESSRGVAVLGKSVMVKGQIHSREDLTIDGEVEGTVELSEHRLTVGPNGRVQATVKAREIVVLGTVHGNVEATDKIDIRKDAKLIGDIKTARIVIEDGAYFKGSIDIVRADAAKAAEKRPPQPAPAPVQSSLPQTSSAPAAVGSAAGVDRTANEAKR
jgi:cytoskeletal protein CcmA (bactofilin family)